jgi:hypothetical protein
MFGEASHASVTHGLLYDHLVSILFITLLLIELLSILLKDTKAGQPPLEIRVIGVRIFFYLK